MKFNNQDSDFVQRCLRRGENFENIVQAFVNDIEVNGRVVSFKERQEIAEFIRSEDK